MIGLNPNFRLERRVPVMKCLTKDGGGCVEAGFWVEAVESWVEAIDGWLETVGSWLEAVDGWVETVGSWVDAVEGWVEAVEGWVVTVGSWVEAVEGWVEAVEGWVYIYIYAMALAKTPGLNLVPKLRNVKYI